MRLIASCRPGEYSLTGDLVGDDPVPPYAILSHTWGPDNDEVNFVDLSSGTGKDKPGWKKLLFCGKWALQHGLQYFWIDTCCIDKSNSAELQEAIVSMYRWYHKADIGFVYLSDASQETDLKQCRWFTRGWTLQELIAPKRLSFFAQDGTYIGDKTMLAKTITNITGIPLDVFQGRRPVAACTVGERLKWSKGRKTKRAEDEVYALFGLFDVTMPVIYGEGRNKAMRRFYEEISKSTSIADTEQGEKVEELIRLAKSVIQSLEERLPKDSSARSGSERFEKLLGKPDISTILPESQYHLFPVANTTVTSKEHSTTALLPFLRSYCLQLLSVITTPLSYFEKSQSFSPESYSISGMGPQMFCYSFFLVEKQAKHAIVTQDLFVAKSQRHWIRIKLRKTVLCGTPQWEPIAPYNPRKSRFGWHPLTQDLISLVQRATSGDSNANDDTEINIAYESGSGIGGALDSTIHNYHPQAISLTRHINFSKMNRDWSLIESLRHQNVRTTMDGSFVTVFLHRTTMLANIDNRWALYTPVLAGDSAFDHAWRSIQSSITLRGNPHSIQLVSVVLNLENKLLKGMIMDLPPKGPLFRIIDNHRGQGRPIPWPIREKWAKQIVRGVAAYHERGTVIECLRSYNLCVCINQHDDAAIFHRGGKGLHPSLYNHKGLLPPECRTDAFASSDGEVGPEFDIFQLGGILWHIYRSQYQQPGRTYCALDECLNANLEFCAKHDNPVALPKPDKDVPEYLHHVISLCRQVDPRDRPTAWELVYLFPSDDEIARNISLLRDEEQIVDGGTKLTRLDTARELYGYAIICDLCSQRCHSVYYRCLTCYSGHFDICNTCFAAGKHCSNTAHLLGKYLISTMWDDHSIKRIRYYSCVDQVGNRAEVVV